MKYPTTMHEATQAAHDERSKAFFELLGWVLKPIRILSNFTVLAIRGPKSPKPAPSPKGSCTI